ncbi:MAG: O-antigen ligase family protein [Ignavibacteriales bacterium]|nr:O-antigen ligase family protein [Ignavibacteriales bacterium]
MNWFFFLYLVVQLIHYFHYQNFNNFLSDTTQAFTFYIIFHVVLKHSDDNYRNSIIAGLLITVALSSLISVYQFFVDTYFFRFGVERPAFGGIFRGNGVFLSDHIQAYFLIPAIFYILLFCKKSLLRDSILILMILGLIVSFHRMSIIAFIVLFLIYLVKIKNKSFKKVFVFFLIIGVIGYLSVKDSLLSSDIYQERISEDTGTYRMLFIAIAIDGIINKPIIGQGTRFSPEYFNMVYAYGFGKETASGRGGGIHNSYLLLGYFQGVPVMLLFIIFLIMTVKYFLKLFDLNNEQLYFFVSLHVIMFMLAGMTNGFIIGSEVGILMGISMALGLKNYLMQKLYDISEVKNYNK